jgi:pilus assembly protein CpaF
MDVVVQVSRLTDGRRRVMSISEVTGMEGDVISMQEIFIFEKRGLEDGNVTGVFRATGIRPRFTERLTAAGERLRPSLFDSYLVV